MGMSSFVKDVEDLIPTVPRNTEAFLVSDDRDPKPAEGEDGEPNPFEGKGPFLEDEEKKVAERVIALWKAQDIPMNRRDAFWRMYAGWRSGSRGLAVQKVEDANQWRVWTVPGTANRAMPDKTDELVRKTVSNLLADDPLPECDPAKDTSEAREAAEFQERILIAETGEAGLNLPRLLRLGLDKAGTWCSSFFWVTPNPTGKGFEPETILAAPQAVDARMPLVDPTTGQVVADVIERYVTEDGQLTDDPSKAKRTWKPGLEVDVLTGRHVRFLPETAKGVDEANGLLVAKYTTFGAIKNLPAVKAMSHEEQKRLTTWKVPEAKRLLPRWARDYLRRQSEADKLADKSGDEIPDGTPCLVLSLYLKGSEEYRDGAYLMVGEKAVLHRQTWYETYQTKTGTTKGECMMVPLAQLRWWDDAQHDDPYGRTVVEKLGPWDEVFASQLSSELDWAFRFNNPNIFLPGRSPVKGKALRRRDGTPIIVRSKDDMPMYEEVPRWPVSSIQLRDDARQAMVEAAGQVGGSLEAPNAKSGSQANAIIAQSNVNLTGTRNNLKDCYERLLRIIAQHMKVYYSVPDKVRYVGEDASYKEQAWSGIDLTDDVTIRCARGSMTGMNRQAKNAYIMQMVQLGLDPAEARRLILSNVSAEIGAEDHPHVLRVRRQIGRWFDGPPKDWVQQAKAHDALMQQVEAQQQALQANPPKDASGRPIPVPPPKMPPPLWTPFDALPCDEEPPIAQLRHQEFVRAMAKSRFGAFDPRWRQEFLTAYTASKKAAAVVTVAEHAQQAEAQRQKGLQGEQMLDAAHESARAKGNIAVEQVKIGQGAKRDSSKILDELKAALVHEAAERAMAHGDPAPVFPAGFTDPVRSATDHV